MDSISYDKIIKEHFDIYNDEDTRKVLLSINEADQNVVLSSLTHKLYDNIVNKVDDIDFGSIERSQGNITLIQNYNEILGCIEVIKKLLTEYKQDLAPISIIENAIKNIKDRTEIWEKGFKFNIEFVMVTYTTMTLAVVSSLSLLISSCIDYIKDTSSESFKATLDTVQLKKTRNSLLFTNLDKFNKSCSKGDLDKALRYIMGNNKQFVGAYAGIGIMSGVAIAALLLSILPIIQELIFFFYFTRVRVADYFETQADLLQMNAYNLQNTSNLPASERKQIYNKQMKVVAAFRKIQNAVAVDCNKAEISAIKEKNTSEKKYKIDDVVDARPDSASGNTSSSSSLF